MINDEPTAIYRFYDADDVLLYVGITNNIKRRWSEHAATKKWWPDVARRTAEWLDSREQADAAEEAAVQNENPLYNWQYAGRVPDGMAFSELPGQTSGRTYWRARPRAAQQDRRHLTDLWVAYSDPPDDDPHSYVNKDGTMHANPAWADMLRRIGAIS